MCGKGMMRLLLCAGGQINNDDSAEDVKNGDLTKVAPFATCHPCTHIATAPPLPTFSYGNAHGWAVSGGAMRM